LGIREKFSIMQTLLRLVLGFVALLVTYLLWIRPWQVRWGATEDEVVRTLPGDDIVSRPTFNATRGVSIQAPPGEIWPWIVQIGHKRVGWYSYDWIDNLGKPSAERIIPELQNLKSGDIIPMSPDGKMGFWVKDFVPNQWMLWWDKKGETTWCWGLYPAGENCTRLVTRVRMHYNWLSPSIIFNLVIDAGDIVMMRKCMLGIKRRAERLASQREEHV
jgi:hypothetical protein